MINSVEYEALRNQSDSQYKVWQNIYITGWSITQVKWSAHIRANLGRQVVFINLISWTKRFINIFSIKLLKAFKNTSINWCFLNVTGFEATLYVETGQSSAVYVLKQWKQFLQFIIIFFSS